MANDKNESRIENNEREMNKQQTSIYGINSRLSTFAESGNMADETERFPDPAPLLFTHPFNRTSRKPSIQKMNAIISKIRICD